MTDDELIVEADKYRKTLLPRADGHYGPYPWWHGWVIVDAFETGYRVAKAEDNKPVGRPNPFHDILECGCTVTNGYRCPFHSQP